MKNNKFKAIDDLILGIELIMSKDRGSLSNEDVVLLKDCCAELLEFRKLKLQKSDIPNELIADVISIILKVFSHIYIDNIM